MWYMSECRYFELGRRGNPVTGIHWGLMSLALKAGSAVIAAGN